MVGGCFYIKILVLPQKRATLDYYMSGAPEQKILLFTVMTWFSGYVHLIMKPAAAGCMRIVRPNNSRDLCYQNKKYKILRVEYFALVPSLNIHVNYIERKTV